MEIKVFSSDNCIWCKRLKEWLKQHKIKYEEKDVSGDPEAGSEMIEISGQSGIPVTVVNNEVIIGFDEAKLRKALKIK